jgi:hypothetical protein
MAYSNFTLAKAKETFGLTLEERRNLFAAIAPVHPSDLLRQVLEENLAFNVTDLSEIMQPA